MKSSSILLLRISIALLVLIWGIDKMADPDHARRISDNFYPGPLSIPALMPLLGAAQVGVALLALVGLFRRIIDPVILLTNVGSLFGVWRSIVDPWGWVLGGRSEPSLIIVAGCLVLIAFQDQEKWVLDRRRRAVSVEPVVDAAGV